MTHIVMEVRQTGPGTYAGFACEGRFGATGSSKQEVVDRIRPKLPLEMQGHEVRIVDLPVHVQDSFVEFDGITHHGEARPDNRIK